jgi:glycerol uptake facilitator-like aquaporin
MTMQKFISEFIGTGLLLAVVTGSGIMGESLSAGNAAVALLGNSIATGCGLYVLIVILGPISGAQINPAVSLMFWRTGNLTTSEMLAYLLAQFTGAISGVWLTHFIFAQPILQVSTHARSGISMWVSELVSTMILLLVIRLAIQHASDKVAILVAMTVTAGYWFTSSTFFANPAVALARGFTETFVGIMPADIVGFIAAQLIAVVIVCMLTKTKTSQ